MGASGQRHAPTRQRFSPGERTSCTHWIRGWVGPRAGLDAGARRKLLCPCRGLNPDRPGRSQTLYCLSYRGSSYFKWTAFNKAPAGYVTRLTSIHLAERQCCMMIWDMTLWQQHIMPGILNAFRYAPELKAEDISMSQCTSHWNRYAQNLNKKREWRLREVRCSFWVACFILHLSIHNYSSTASTFRRIITRFTTDKKRRWPHNFYVTILRHWNTRLFKKKYTFSEIYFTSTIEHMATCYI
jgi:hypothetical protein